MSLFSKVLIPKLEAELALHEPEIASMLLKATHELALDVAQWANDKINNQGAKNEA